jgi:hypothetical protein
VHRRRSTTRRASHSVKARLSPASADSGRTIAMPPEATSNSLAHDNVAARSPTATGMSLKRVASNFDDASCTCARCAAASMPMETSATCARPPRIGYVGVPVPCGGVLDDRAARPACAAARPRRGVPLFKPRRQPGTTRTADPRTRSSRSVPAR